MIGVALDQQAGRLTEPTGGQLSPRSREVFEAGFRKSSTRSAPNKASLRTVPAKEQRATSASGCETTRAKLRPRKTPEGLSSSRSTASKTTPETTRAKTPKTSKTSSARVHKKVSRCFVKIVSSAGDLLHGLEISPSKEQLKVPLQQVAVHPVLSDFYRTAGVPQQLGQGAIHVLIGDVRVDAEKPLSKFLTKGKSLDVVVQMPAGVQTAPVLGGISIQQDRPPPLPRQLPAPMGWTAAVDVLDAAGAIWSACHVISESSFAYDTLVRGVVAPVLEDYYALVSAPCASQGAVSFTVDGVEHVDGSTKVSYLLARRTDRHAPLHVVVHLPAAATRAVEDDDDVLPGRRSVVVQIL